MKLFEVKYEEDGRTVKAPGVSETTINSCSLFYAAETIEAVWEAVEDLRASEDRRLTMIRECVQLVNVLRSPATST